MAALGFGCQAWEAIFGQRLRLTQMQEKLRYYMSGQATSLGAYILEQIIYTLFGWIPSIVGLGLRAITYKLILHSEGLPAIEHGTRLVQGRNIRLGRGAYVDHGVYLHATPGGISIGNNTFIMHRSALHVFNFRGLPKAGITIGNDCFIGEMTVMRGQGGIYMGNKVYTGPFVQILAVNHVFSDPNVPIADQGITAQGIVIEDDVWIGAGAMVLDGVRIGTGSVIGAGAVVSQDIPPYSLAVGSPAKPIKDRRQLATIKNGKHSTEPIYFGALETMGR